MSELFEIKKLDHLEFYVGDAKNVSKIFKYALGMNFIAQSLQETHNHQYYSYVLQTHEIKFIITSPQVIENPQIYNNEKIPNPKFNSVYAFEWLRKHGNGVYAIGLEVADAEQAYTIAIQKGAVPRNEPYQLIDKDQDLKVTIAEIQAYGD